jgi:hypothetical protein
MPRPIYILLLTWGFPLAVALLTAAVSIIEHAAIRPGIRLFDDFGRQTNNYGFALIFQPIFLLGMATIIGCRLARPLTWFTPFTTIFSLAIFGILTGFPEIGAFLAAGQAVTGALFLTIVGIPIAIFAGPGATGAYFGVALMINLVVAKLDIDGLRRVHWRAILACCTVAAVVYFFAVTGTRVYSLHPDLNVWPLRTFLIISVGILVAGSLITWGAWQVAGGPQWTGSPISWTPAIAFVITVLLALAQMVNGYTKQNLTVLPEIPGIVRDIGDRLRLGHPHPDEPLRVGDYDLLLPRFQPSTRKSPNEGSAAINGKNRQVTTINWPLRDQPSVEAVKHITLQKYQTTNGIPSDLVCARSLRPAYSECRKVRPSRNEDSIRTLDSRKVLLWANVSNDAIVEFGPNSDGSYLIRYDQNGSHSCRLVIQNYPAEDYWLEARFDCAQHSEWPALLERLRAYIQTHLKRRPE